MNDIIFEQDKPDRDLLDRASNADLDITIPGIFSSKPLCVRRGEKLSRAEVIRRVANDLRLTLEERDGIYTFRFPDVWNTQRVQEVQKRVLDGIALVERRCNFSLVIWTKDIIVDFMTGLRFLFGHQPLEEPDLENAFPLGRSGFVSPPQGGNATIPVESRQGGLTTRDVVTALAALGRALACPEKASDSQYDEPQATYPEMVME